MSWTQGIQDRADLPAKFRQFADREGGKREWGEIQCLVWDATEPEIVFLDYGENGSLRLDLTGIATLSRISLKT